MDTLLLFDIPVDRCQPHGVWFDKDELADVLERSASLLGGPPTVAIAPAAEDPVASSIAVDFAGEVLTGTSGVTEGILELLGAIVSAIDF